MLQLRVTRLISNVPSPRDLNNHPDHPTMDDSDSSSLSSLPSSEDESPKSPEVNRKTLTLKGGKLTAGPVAPVKKGPAPRKRNAPAAPRSPSTSPERETSPPHDYVLADNPDIAVSLRRLPFDVVALTKVY